MMLCRTGANMLPGKNEPKELSMISVVVPVYNEEEIISLLHDAVVRAMSKLRDTWEVVYVNDGSTDSTLQLLRTLQLTDTHVVVVDLSRNWGHMGAISAGLQTAARRCGCVDGWRPAGPSRRCS